MILFLVLLACKESREIPGGGFAIDRNHASPPNQDSLDLISSTRETFNSSSKVAIEETVEELGRYFTRKNKYNGFNGTVLYAVDGKIEFAKAYGYADLRKKDSLKLESSFQLASVSKPITSLAVLLLVEQGQVGLEDSLQVYFPDFPYHGITIRHLLTHRSGLPNYMYFCDSIWTNWEVPITNRDVLNIMIKDQPKVYYPPDRRYNYCNTNFALLALLVEQVSEMSFDLYVKSRIFLPLDMQDAQIYNKSITPVNYQAVKGYTGYRREADNTYLNGVVGDKGVYASVLDLFKLDQALQTGKLISHDLLDKAYEPQHKDLWKSDNYGLGWRINDSDPGNKVVYHTGWWKGFRSYFIRELGARKTIIVLTNTDRSGRLGLAELRGLVDN